MTVSGAKMTEFSSIWFDLQKKLRSHTEIQAWSRQKGYLDTRFNIVSIEAGRIFISSGGTSAPRPISKSDMARVYKSWPLYCDGKLSRAEMRNLSQNTTYIFGLLKWCEQSKSIGQLIGRRV